MSVAIFMDTNILVYAASRRREHATKRTRALELIAGPEFGTSAQVMAEFYVTVTRKGEPPMPPLVALEWLEQLELQPCVEIDAALVKRGIEHSLVHRISYRDGAIVAAAEALGATTLYSEDMSHGQMFGQVRVINPFLEPA